MCDALLKTKSFFKKSTTRYFKSINSFSFYLGSNFNKYDITTEVVTGNSNFQFVISIVSIQLLYLYQDNF